MLLFVKMQKISNDKKVDSDGNPESKTNIEATSSNSITHSFNTAPIKSNEKSIADISSFISPRSLSATNPLPRPIPDWLSRPHTSFYANIPTNNLNNSSTLQQIANSDWISQQLKDKLVEIGYYNLFPGMII